MWTSTNSPSIRFPIFEARKTSRPPPEPRSTTTICEVVRVGPEGRAIGIDMTTAMIAKASSFLKSLKEVLSIASSEKAAPREEFPTARPR
jgi:hypothetical protein